MRILFQGDSVTDCNRNYEDFFDLGDGYVMYTVENLKQQFPEADFEFINKGISGNRTKDVLARARADIVDIDPDVITILIGVNDTWRRFDMNDPTTAEEFRNNYESILKIIKEKTRAKIVMLECFVIYGMGRDEYREDLNAKIDETRKLAYKYADAFIPLDGILAEACMKVSPELISADGVHPAVEGRKIIASHLAPVIGNIIKEL